MSPGPDLLSRTLAGEEVWLLAERALYWPARESLIVADLHWGKGATFRRAGLPIPAGTTSDDLGRLDAALARTHARRLLILGDLFHARSGRGSPSAHAALSAWRQRHQALEMVLVRGNHDWQSGDPGEDLAVACVDEPLHEGPFEFRHHPSPDPERFLVHGHVHPLVRLAGRGRQHEHLAAFVMEPDRAILPAFGSFTGGGVIDVGPESDLVVIADGELLTLPRGLATEAHM